MVERNVRGGAETRKRTRAADKAKNNRYKCPRCEKHSVKRDSNSIWICGSCKTVYAGGAYTFSTPAGNNSKRFTQ